MIDISIRYTRGVIRFDYQFRSMSEKRSALGVFLQNEMESLKARVTAFTSQLEGGQPAPVGVERKSNISPEVSKSLHELRALIAAAQESGKAVDLGEIDALKQKLIDSGISVTPKGDKFLGNTRPAANDDFNVEGVKVTGGKFDAGSKEKSTPEVEEAQVKTRWERRQAALAQASTQESPKTKAQASKAQPVAARPEPKIADLTPEAIIKAGAKKKGSQRAKPVGSPYQ